MMNLLTLITQKSYGDISLDEFGKRVKDKKIYLLDGVIDSLGFQLIANGVKLSTEVERRIKDLF